MYNKTKSFYFILSVKFLITYPYLCKLVHRRYLFFLQDVVLKHPLGWSDEFFSAKSNSLSIAAALQSVLFRSLLPSSPQTLCFPMTTNSRHHIYMKYFVIDHGFCSSFIEIYVEIYRTRNTMYFLGPVSFCLFQLSLRRPGNDHSYSMIARCMVTQV